MSEIIAIRFCSLQLMKGNFHPWRFLVKRWVRGLLAWKHCNQCGKSKPINLWPVCSRCQIQNFKRALFENEEA